MLPNEYNHLAKKVHHAAVQNGWFETSRTDTALLLLIQSEAFEMFDAYRNQKHCNLKDFICIYDKFFVKNDFEESIFKQLIKDTFQDEFTDTIMRILDLAAYKQIQFKSIGIMPRNNDFVLDFSAFVKQCDANGISSNIVGICFNSSIFRIEIVRNKEMGMLEILFR